MSASEIENSIRTAMMSLEMEGLRVDEECATWCRQMLSGELTMDDYLSLVVGKLQG